MKLSKLIETKSPKYEFVEGNTTEINGHLVRRIRCITNQLENVQYGDYGGYIESDANLSQTGNSWVYADAVVYGPVVIDGFTLVHDTGFYFTNSDIRTLKGIPKFDQIGIHLCQNIHEYDGPDEAYEEFIVCTNTHFSVKNIPLNSNLDLTAITNGKLLHLPNLIKYRNVFLNIMNKGSGLSEIDTVLKGFSKPDGNRKEQFNAMMEFQCWLIDTDKFSEEECKI